MLFRTIQNEPVPALGLGTYRLKGTAGRAAVVDALDIGYRNIDTAQSYENEEDVGLGIADSAVERSDVFITTKIWMSNLSAERVRSSTEESLRKLKTDYVDLLLIHWPSDDVPLQETTADPISTFSISSYQRTRWNGSLPLRAACASLIHPGVQRGENKTFFERKRFWGLT